MSDQLINGSSQHLVASGQTHPEFYNLFKGARVIVDLKGKQHPTDKNGGETPPEDETGAKS